MLFKFACMMQAKGASDNAVFAATMAENESKCNNPIDEKEVRTIVNSALKYEKGKPIHFDENGTASQGWREPIFNLTDKDVYKRQTLYRATQKGKQKSDRRYEVLVTV